MPPVLVLLPTYNERDNVAKIIPRIFAAVPDAAITVIDDSSPDGTADAVRSLMREYKALLLFSRPKKEGLGRAYTDGFKKALMDFPNAEYICMMDADGSHDPKDLPRLLEATKAADMAIGSRYINGGAIIGWELIRRLLSRLGNDYARLITRLPVKDATSGFCAIRSDVLRRINFSNADPSGYAFQIHLKYRLWQSGARLIECPIAFRNRQSGESKISLKIVGEGLLIPWRLKQKQQATREPRLCPVCRSNTGYYWFSKNSCNLYRCNVCRLVYVSPIPQATDTIYSADYFAAGEQGFGCTNEGAENHAFVQYLLALERKLPTKGELLDVGAATGGFLHLAKERGWKTHGVEISSYAAEACRKYGLDVQTGTLENIQSPRQSFDVITLWDVFEHVQNPDATLDHISALLKPQGILAMNLPNAGSLFAKCAGRFWPLLVPPEHLHLFNKTNLRTMLERHNFSLEENGVIGKRFRLPYIFLVLYTVRYNKLWQMLADFARRTTLRHIIIPLNLRDNMFIIARKKS